MPRESKTSGSWSSSAPEEIAILEPSGQEKRVELGTESRFGEAEVDNSTRPSTMRRKLASILSKEPKIHQSSIARVELVLLTLSAMRPLHLR